MICSCTHSRSPIILLFLFTWLIQQSSSYLGRFFTEQRLNYKLVKKMATFTSGSSNWNAESGVWLNEMVPDFQTQQLPKPLYIFGYGSLLWRPGKYLDQLSQYHAICLGWTRRFAQKSCDHRGTFEFPGLVLTLVESDYLNARGMSHNVKLDCRMSLSEEMLSTGMEEHCTGAIFYIPDDLVDVVIDELDFREKGGYQKQLIKVKLMEATKFHNAGDVADALVYVGATDNPNFHLPLTPKEELLHHKGSQMNSFMSSISDVITTAVGPSGSNVDYLLNLVAYLNKMNYQDDHLNQLADIVRQRLGPWKSQWSTGTNTFFERSKNKKPSGHCLHSILGWGSNEFNQITINRRTPDADIIPFPQKIYSSELLNLTGANNINLKNSQYWAISGGRISGILSKDGVLLLWGSLAKKIAVILSLYDINFTSSGSETSIIAIANVKGAAAGHDHMLLLLQSGHIMSIGDDSYGQSSSELADWLIYLKPQYFLDPLLEVQRIGSLSDLPTVPIYDCKPSTAVKTNCAPAFIKLAIGLRHSAAITAQGDLFTWGCNKYNQCFAEKLSAWKPPNGAKVIDVACGARHTVAIDDLGRMWITGSCKYIEETRRMDYADPECKMKQIQNIEAGIRWQRISSGWSHIVARGVRPDGSLICIGIGRQDLGQYPTSTKSDGKDVESVLSDTSMSILSPLPDSCPFRELWTGSEFTIACDSNHRLWACGWNEHGNLGLGHRLNTDTWSRVCDDQGQQLAIQEVWEGSIACGGSHVLCSGIESEWKYCW